MSVQVVVFYLLTAIIVVSAVLATYLRNVVNAAYSLFFTLLALAGIYVLLGADFIAITQVVIYVGGILVLLLFGVLLTNRRLEDLVAQGTRSYVIGTVAGAMTLALLCRIIAVSSWPSAFKPNPTGTTQPLGYLLLRDYLLPFELSSITLLAALIGAAYLVRPKEQASK